MHDIFLSYSRKDTEMMQRVKQSFRDAGFKVWTDEGIEPGTSSWKRAIEQALIDTKCLVCLASPDSKNSEWVEEELNVAKIHGKFIFLILISGDEKTAIPFGFLTHQFTDTRPPNDYETKIKRLISTIQKKLGVNKPGVKALLPPPFDWCEIPAGKVTLDLDLDVPEGVKSFDVPAFLMAKYPITNAQYKLFIDSGGYQNKQWWTDEGWQEKEKEGWSEPRDWSNAEPDWAEYPAVNVSWYESNAFCLWLSEASSEKVMLPIEQQWQRAAQGDDERVYPWGNDFDESKANTKESRIHKPTVVTAYPNGASPYGVMGMAGNVWEWGLTPDSSEQNTLDGLDILVRRGGSFRSDSRLVRTTFRNGHMFLHWDGVNGFRICAAIS